MCEKISRVPSRVCCPKFASLEFNSESVGWCLNPRIRLHKAAIMSLMFKPPAKDRHLDPNLVRTMLDENALLIKIVTEYQNKGKIYECMKYQHILTRNLLYLSGISDFQADEAFRPFPPREDKHD